MECKFSLLSTTIIKSSELIDTLWNVNKPREILSVPFRDELIDTLWNVNVKISQLYSMQQ